jgi:hypothetical protein
MPDDLRMMARDGWIRDDNIVARFTTNIDSRFIELMSTASKRA